MSQRWAQKEGGGVEGSDGGPVRGAEQAAGLQTRSVLLMAFNPHCSHGFS